MNHFNLFNKKETKETKKDVKKNEEFSFTSESEHDTKDNVIYINGEISDSFFELTKKLKEIVSKQSKLREWKIVIYINSPWGDLIETFNFLSIIDHAKQLGIKIITVVTSLIASAASVIAIQGDERYVSKFAAHLIHFPRWVSYQENPDQLENNNKMWKFYNETLVSTYKRFTKLRDPEKKMTQDNYTIRGADELIKQWFADFRLEDSQEVL